MRYLAQRTGTWEWLDTDLVLDVPGPEWTDSLYGTIQATIAPDLWNRRGADGRRLIEPMGTLIHAETPDERKWTGLVSAVDAKGKDLEVTIIEWAGYLDGLTFNDRIWGVKADPADLFRQVWNHVQSYPNGDLGVTVTGSTPLRLGTDSSDKAIAAKAAMKKAKAKLDATANARKAKSAQVQKASKPFAADIKRLEASRKAAADELEKLTKSKSGKNGSSGIYWPFPTSTVSQWPSGSHNGTDFAIPSGTPVAACVDGVVVLTGDDGRGAWCVHVKRSDGLVVQSGHLSRIDAKVGQRVTATTRVGLSGGIPGTPGAGVSTGAHLHWELRRNTVWSGPVVDPRTLTPGGLGVPTSPAAPSAVIAAQNRLKLAQDALAAKRVQRDAAIGPLKTQLEVLRDAETAARAPYEAAQKKSQAADEQERKDGGAYRVFAADNPDCWRIIKDLCDETGISFTTHTKRTTGKPQLEMRVHYPGLGQYRSDLVFQQGINIISELELSTTGEYASEVIVNGAGEGDSAIRQSVASPDKRMRRTAVVDDKRITSKAKASAVGRYERERRTSDFEIAEITVRDHLMCPMSSWSVGDVILVQGTVPHYGTVAMKHRIVSWAMAGDYKAVLKLERSV